MKDWRGYLQSQLSVVREPCCKQSGPQGSGFCACALLVSREYRVASIYQADQLYIIRHGGSSMNLISDFLSTFGCPSMSESSDNWIVESRHSALIR